MLRSTVLLSMMLLSPPVAIAQAMSAPHVGTRIRATPVGSNASRVIGLVAGRSGDTLLVQTQPGETIAVPLATLRLLEVSDGRRSNVVNGVGLGALAGSLGGAAIGAAVMRDDWLGPRFGVLFGAVVGLGGGALIGGIVGASVQTDRWSTAPGWELSLALPPSGRGLRLSLRF